MQSNNFANFNAAFPPQGGNITQPNTARQYNAAPMTMVPQRGGAGAGVAPGAPLPGRTAQQLALKAHEKALFDSLFFSCEGSRGPTQSVSGGAIKALFTASRLPKASLAAVWSLSDRQKRKVLDQEDFYIACRLIAIAQQNLPVTYQSLTTYLEIPLPHFDGVAMPGAAQGTAMPPMQQQQQQQQLPQQPQTARKSVAPPMTTAGPGLAGVPLGAPGAMGLGGQGSMDLLGGGVGSAAPSATGASFPVSLGRAPSSGSTAAAGSAPLVDEWSMTPTERAQYISLFSQADADQDGFVGGKEANLFFRQSGLDNATLKQIWLLSDVDRDNKLNPEEFSIAMHLTLRVRKKQPLPPTLPLSIDPRQQQQQQQQQRAAPAMDGLGLGSAGPSSAAVQQQQQPLMAGNFGASAPMMESNKTKSKLDLDLLPDILPTPLQSAAPPMLQQAQQPQQDFLFDSVGGGAASSAPGGVARSASSSKATSRRTSMDFGFGSAPSAPAAPAAPQQQQQQSSFGFGSGLSLNTATPSSNVSTGNSSLSGFGVASDRGLALIEATQNLDDRNKQLQSLHAQTEQAKAASAAADARLAEKLHQLEEVTAQVAAADRALAEQRAHTATVESQHTEAETRLHEAHRRLAELKEQTASGEARIRDLQESTTTTKREAAELAMQTSLVESQLASMRSALKSVEDLKDGAAGILQARREQQSRLLHEKSELSELLATSKMQLARMKEEAAIIKNSLHAHQEGVDELHAILAEHREIVAQEKLRPSPRTASYAAAPQVRESPSSAISAKSMSPMDSVDKSAGSHSAAPSSSPAAVSTAASASPAAAAQPAKAKPTHRTNFSFGGDDDAFNIDDIQLPSLDAHKTATPAPAASPVVAASPAAAASPVVSSPAASAPAAAEPHQSPPAAAAPQSKVAAAVGAINRAASRNASIDWTSALPSAVKAEEEPEHAAPAASPPAQSPAPAASAAAAAPVPHHAPSGSVAFQSQSDVFDGLAPAPLTTSSPIVTVAPAAGAANGSPQSTTSAASAALSPPAPAVPSFPSALEGTGVPDAFAHSPAGPASSTGADAAETGNPWSDDEDAGEDPFGPTSDIAPAVLSPPAKSVFGEAEEDDPWGAAPSSIGADLAAAAPNGKAAAADHFDDPFAAAPATSPVAPATVAAAASSSAPAAAAAKAHDDFADFDAFNDAPAAAAPAAAPPAAATTAAAPAAVAPVASPAPVQASPVSSPAAAAPAVTAAPVPVASPADKKAAVASSFEAAMSEDWAAFD